MVFFQNRRSLLFLKSIRHRFSIYWIFSYVKNHLLSDIKQSFSIFVFFFNIYNCFWYQNFSWLKYRSIWLVCTSVRLSVFYIQTSHQLLTLTSRFTMCIVMNDIDRTLKKRDSYNLLVKRNWSKFTQDMSKISLGKWRMFKFSLDKWRMYKISLDKWRMFHISLVSAKFNKRMFKHSLGKWGNQPTDTQNLKFKSRISLKHVLLYISYESQGNSTNHENKILIHICDSQCREKVNWNME